MPVLFAVWSSVPGLPNWLIIIVGIFLSLLTPIQRGKGGGLAGAFGGVGGSSPFGSKAGDTFTRVTIWVAAIWIVIIMAQVRATNSVESSRPQMPGEQTSSGG